MKKKIRIIAIATALALLLGALAVGIFTASAVETDDQGLQYTLSSDGQSYSVTKYTGTATEVVIPSTYNDKPVTSIGDYAFSRCSSLTNIVFSDNIVSIGNFAFGLCSGLMSISIPATVTNIVWGAFSGCDKVKTIEVSQDNPVYHSAGNCIIETASRRLVVGCPISKIPTDGSVTIIGTAAFQNLTTVTSIEIPDSITVIENASFACSSWQSITIPESVTSIGGEAFGFCTALEELVIPKNVTEVGEFLLDGSNALKTITFLSPDTVIYDDDDMIPTQAVIRGYEGSTAQAYAEKYDRTFELIEEEGEEEKEEPTPVLYGDANGDGVVNGQDLLLLRKYLANFDYTTGQSTIVLGPSEEE